MRSPTTHGGGPSTGAQCTCGQGPRTRPPAGTYPRQAIRRRCHLVTDHPSGRPAGSPAVGPGHDRSDRRRHAERLRQPRRDVRPCRHRHQADPGHRRADQRLAASSSFGRDARGLPEDGVPARSLRLWLPRRPDLGEAPPARCRRRDDRPGRHPQPRADTRHLEHRDRRRAPTRAPRTSSSTRTATAGSTARPWRPPCGTAGIATLVVVGATTSVCVDSTVRDAVFRDFHCVVIEDCTAEPIALDAPAFRTMTPPSSRSSCSSPASSGAKR